MDGSEVGRWALQRDPRCLSALILLVPILQALFVYLSFFFCRSFSFGWSVLRSSPVLLCAGIREKGGEGRIKRNDWASAERENESRQEKLRRTARKERGWR